MNAIRARLAAILAGLLLARLVDVGLADASPELAVALQRWVEQSIELLSLLVYSLVERRARDRPHTIPRGR